MRAVVVLGVCLLSPILSAAVDCVCDPAKPESFGARQCSLCKEAEAHPQDAGVFFLKDINPRKPNRMLALPRVHAKDNHTIASLPPDIRTSLWKAAIEKARSLHGDRWALALNGDEVRTQCHTHIHIGKLIDGVETEWFIVVDGPEQIPAPQDGTGLWVHPAADGKLHVHTGEQITESVLLR
jgi:hypothetical protein